MERIFLERVKAFKLLYNIDSNLYCEYLSQYARFQEELRNYKIERDSAYVNKFIYTFDDEINSFLPNVPITVEGNKVMWTDKDSGVDIEYNDTTDIERELPLCTDPEHNKVMEYHFKLALNRLIWVINRFYTFYELAKNQIEAERKKNEEKMAQRELREADLPF